MIRKAMIDDSEDIAKLIIRSWQTAYRGIIDDDFLDSLSLEKIQKAWKNSIASQNDDDKIFVYVEDNTIIGVIRFGAPQDKKDLKHNAEIHVLYVDPKLKRKGIGSKLFEYAKNYFINQGNKNLIIWCLKGNKQGANFYKKMGGREVANKKSIINNIETEDIGFEFNLN